MGDSESKSPRSHSRMVKRRNQNPEMLASGLSFQAIFLGHGPQTGTQIRLHPLTPVAHRVYHALGELYGGLHGGSSSWVRRLYGECHVPEFFCLTFPWTSLQHRPQVTCRLSHFPSWKEPLRPEAKCCFRNREASPGGQRRPRTLLPPEASQRPPGQVWKKGRDFHKSPRQGWGSGRSFPQARPISLGSQCFRLPLTAVTQLCDLKTLMSTHPSTSLCHPQQSPAQ